MADYNVLESIDIPCLRSAQKVQLGKNCLASLSFCQTAVNMQRISVDFNLLSDASELYYLRNCRRLGETMLNDNKMCD